MDPQAQHELYDAINQQLWSTPDLLGRNALVRTLTEE